MKRIVALILAIVVCIELVSCMPNLKKYIVKYADDPIHLGADDAQAIAYLDFVNRINSFALKMNDSISDQNTSNSNFCISPASLYMSLAVACEGANGETREEILNALGITYEQLAQFTKYYYAACNTQYTYVDDFGTEHISAHEELATSIWLNSALTYKNSGVSELSKNYNCDVFSIPYSDGTADKIISQYVKYKTHEVITSGVDFGKDTPFAILSLFHLKEIWNEFGTNLSVSLENYDFKNTDGSTAEKQLLKSTYAGGVAQRTTLYTTFYIETEHGYKLHFMIPNARYTLDRVFTPTNIQRMLSISDYKFIDDTNKKINYTRVIFPHFDASYNGDVSKILKEDFEITALFDKEKCDFSNLLYEKAYCDNFIHKAVMRVDAKGIEGTYIDLAQSTHKPPQLPDYEKVYHDLVLDRAFGFVLTDPNGIILYTGEVNSLK